MRNLSIFVLAVFLSGYSFAVDTVMVNTNGVVKYPTNFLDANSIPTKAALTSTSTADRAYSDTLFTNLQTRVDNTNAAQDVTIGGKVGTNDSAYILALTNGTGNGATVTVTGRQFHIYVSVPTGSAASVQANLDLHSDPTNTAAHNVTNVTGLIDLLAGKASTSATNGLADTNYVNAAVSGKVDAVSLGSAAYSNAGAFYASGNPSNYVTAAVTNGAEIGSHAGLLTEATSLGATNVTGGILTFVDRMVGLTASAISNAVAGVYALVDHFHSSTAITNAPWALEASYVVTSNTAAGALQAEADTLSTVAARGDFSGTETITPLRVSAKMFGYNAGNLVNPVYSDWCAVGDAAGTSAAGDYWNGLGYWSGSYSIGDSWTAVGNRAGNYAVWTNSVAVGSWAGRSATGNNRLYIDVYDGDPGAGSSTNNMIFGDNGTLYLGRPNNSLYLRGSVYGLTPAQINAVSNSLAGIAAAGGLTNGGATVDGMAISNGAAIRTYSMAPVVLAPQGPTQWLSYVDGPCQYLAPTGNVTLAMSNNWPATEVIFFNLSIYSGAYSVSADYATISSSMWVRVEIDATKTNSAEFHRGFGMGKFAVVCSTNWGNP